MKTYVQYPPRKMQSMGYDAPVALSKYEKFHWLREQLGKLGKEGIKYPVTNGQLGPAAGVPSAGQLPCWVAPGLPSPTGN